MTGIGITGTPRETWKVATTFIGTIVGAGFASGQEILKFFSHFGCMGIAGLILSCLLFCITGILIMSLGHRLRAVSFGEVVSHVCGRHLGPVMELLLGLFLFGSLSVMLAGAGAVFSQQWGIPYFAGTVITLIISVITVLSGMKGIINANSIVVPIMVIVCLTATVPAVSGEKLRALHTGFLPVAQGASSFWGVSALLYVSYNMTMGVSVLAPLGKEIRNRQALVWGGILGGLGLGIMALFINLAILSHYPDSAGYEIPSLFLAGRLARTVQMAFSFVLWAEIFTTIIGTVFGLAARISGGNRTAFTVSAVLLMVLALVLSQFGFSGLVGTVYPLFGYVSLLFLIALFASPYLRRN